MARPRDHEALRRLIESVGRAVYRGGWAARVAYAIGLQRVPEERIHAIGLPLTEPHPPPLELAFGSDFHAGPLTDERVLRAARAALARSPLVLLGGDYVSLRASDVDVLADLLAAVAAPLGCYAVLGNHDHWSDPGYVARRLEASGVRVLRNESVRLPAPYQRVRICGLDDPGHGEPDVDATFCDADADADAEGARILLMHSPGGVRLARGRRYELALCGHTHGGQIALPGGTPVLLPRGRDNRRWSRGLHRLPETGAVLLVSRGVGTSALPVRLFAAAEVHRIQIRWEPEVVPSM